MSAVAIPAQAPGDSSVPQLRTILLTDLCDSTQLVERLGDSAAADLFRRHDLLVLQLQQQWRGRLIDRSDGMLLLFERPIDGLGFALDYARGLRELGREHHADLKARAGLHVGEVLTWRNSEEAVKVGAKPLEVEGLAKPMAARLMTMARPGQVLVSAVAEPLAHRSARELGERGQQLLWKSYGRWRFKGLPTPQEVFEVGEAGIAPLRQPRPTPKAWRDVPLWRRPAALIVELAIILGIGLGIWFITRPQPAVAFNERDWVVVADLRNLTGQPVLDDSLEQAFRISLEQSRYVNVLSDLKARQTLERMRLPSDTELTRAVASEIAIRDGARAVILPTVAEVGGQVRVSAEVIDPHSQTTVYSEYADGPGIASTLTSVDDVTKELRIKLGEALKSVQKDFKPLPEVTTENIDALRAYALGQEAYGQSQYGPALQFYTRATELDPEFALAWLGRMRVQYATVNTAAAIRPLREAQALRGRLTPREAMYLDAWIARFDDPARETGKWVELARLYPDFGPGLSNAAMALGKDNRHAEAMEFASAAAKMPRVDTGIDLDALGRAHLAIGNFEKAEAAFRQALSQGYAGSIRRLVAVAAASGDFAAAEKRIEDLPRDSRYAYLEMTSVAIDRQRWPQARELARAGLALAGEDGYDSRMFRVPVAVAEWLAGDGEAALRHAREAGRLALGALAVENNPNMEEDATLAIVAALVEQRLGYTQLASEVLAFVGQNPSLLDVANVSRLEAVLSAEQLRLAHKPLEAIEVLEPELDGKEFIQTRVALMNAYADAGDLDAALEQVRWLKLRRGLAYGELDCGYCRQALNVADTDLAIEREKELLETLAHSKLQ